MFLLIRSIRSCTRKLLLLIGLIVCCSQVATAQCYYPPINITVTTPPYIQIDYWVDGDPDYSFEGEVRWYLNETDTDPVQSYYIAYGYSPIVNMSNFPGSSAWYEVYDYGKNCTSRREFYGTGGGGGGTPTLNYNAKACGDYTAQVHAWSNTAGVTFQLFYRDPSNGAYQVLYSNNTGDFDIPDFTANNQYNYYLKVLSPYADYQQVIFEFSNPTPPTLTGSTTWCEGTPPVLSVSGVLNIYRWFDGNNNLLFEGPQFTPPSGLTAGTYNYQVRGYNPIGCYTNPTYINAIVNPRPVDGTITASATTVYVCEPVTISSQGAVGTPHYWGSSNGGASWDLFADDHVNQQSFTQTFTAPGTYRFHTRNSTVCGFCWDAPGGCTTFPYIDITVVDFTPAVIGSITPASQTIPYNGTAAAITVSSVSGGTGSYSYQWQSSGNSAFDNPENIPGANFISYTPIGLTGSKYYRLVVSTGCSNGVSKIAYSPVAQVIVYPKLEPNTIVPAEVVIPSGTKPGVITAGPASGGACSGNYQYQWQQSADGGNFTDIPQAVAITYDPPVQNASVYYRRKVSCAGVEAFTNACHVIIGTVTTTLDLNYIRIRAFERPGILDVPTANSITAVREAKQSTDYFDGLARKMQTVIKQGSTNNNGYTDMVAPVVYDAFGREAVKWLPYASPSGDGNYKPNPLLEINGFYKVQEPNEHFYYSQSIVESSPLNRVQKIMPQGDNWTGGGRGIESNYSINTSIDAVRIWNVTDVPNGLGNYYTPAGEAGKYLPGALYKNITTDEKGAQVIEFKDKTGMLILRKVQLTATPDNGEGSGYTGWLCTYYIYDDLRNLRCVVQPRGVELLIQNNWDFSTLNGGILNEQCFRNEYDHRKRVIMKKIPGAGVTYLVYDMRDRLVMKQDANMRTLGKWIVTGYDSQNRPVSTGLWTNNTPFSNHLSAATASSSYPSVAMLATGYELLAETHYDDYNNLPAGLTSTLDNNWGSEFISLYNTAPDYALEMTKSPDVKGLPTWNRSKVLGTASQFLPTVNIYDKYGRIIQVKSINQTGETDLVSSQYDFAGKILRTAVTHRKSYPNGLVTYLFTRNTYDDLSRITKTENKVSLNNWKVISSTDYDALGRLKHKNLGTKPGTTADPLETLTYDYNIRDWLLGVNRDYIGQNPSDNYFGFELGYDKSTNKANQNFNAVQFNGNINGLIWKSKGDGTARKYDFGYDALNRLLKADFVQHNTDGSWNNNEVNFGVKIGDGSNPNSAYDANGNIQRMQQWGLKGTVAAQIDDLGFNYTINSTGTQVSNKLYKVADVYSDPNTKLGDFKDGTNTGDDYDYDGNGNLKMDNNKGIGNITYNHLNLPQLITLPNKGTTEYTYDASGNKLKKVVTESDLKTTTQYIMGFAYETREHTVPAGDDYYGKQLYIPQEEGRIRLVPEEQKYYYDYFIKDHLGNVRMVLTEQQKQDLYPAATMEGNINSSTDAVYYENQFYNINTGNIVNKPANATNINKNGGPAATDPPANPNYYSDVTANSQKMYQLKANPVSGAGAAGLGITLKVMSGDRIDIWGKTYYADDNTNNPDYSIPVLDILTGLLGAPTGVTAGKGLTPTGLNSITGVHNGVDGFLGDPTRGGSGSIPKAYINWILLDENFKYVNGHFHRVDKPNIVEDHTLSDIEVTKNGYLYVYVSNESPIDVYFDNLQVMHTHGPILEETHYYPFGLTMAGISSKALAGTSENKIKFQSQEFATNEFSDCSGLDLYEFKWRMHDPQTGRFWQTDPLADKYLYNSTYAFSENKVTGHIELEGLEAKLAIAGSGNNASYHSDDVNAFKDRADNLQKKAGFTAVQVKNGDQIVSTLKDGTKKEGSVGAVVIFAHASQAGIYLDNNDGLYRGNEYHWGNNSANVTELKNAVDRGEIKFDDNAVVVMGACNCGKDDGKSSLAETMAKELNVTVYAATGSVYPEVVDGKETGRLKTDGTFNMYKMTGEVTIDIPGYGPMTFPAGVGVTKVGSTIDPAKLTSQSTSQKSNQNSNQNGDQKTN